MTALREFLIFAAVLVGFAGVLTLIISIYALALFSVVGFFLVDMT